MDSDVNIKVDIFFGARVFENLLINLTNKTMGNKTLNLYEPTNGISHNVKHSATDVIKLAREALMNGSGAYNALRLLGAERHLPGLNSCENKRKEALEAIDSYLKST